jgi:hypothetical protein
MNRNQLADALSTLPQTDRDLAEKIIINPATLTDCWEPGYTTSDALRDANYEEENGLHRLLNLELITFLNGYWHWIAGPVSDFFAIRLTNNFE